MIAILSTSRSRTRSFCDFSRAAPRLVSEAQQKTFFATYSDALEKKYPKRLDESREAGFFHFTTADGGVFLRCVKQECAELEGGNGGIVFDLY